MIYRANSTFIISLYTNPRAVSSFTPGPLSLGVGDFSMAEAVELTIT